MAGMMSGKGKGGGGMGGGRGPSPKTQLALKPFSHVGIQWVNVPRISHVVGPGQPLVSDFGLAKRMHGGACITQSGTILGSPAYMSPEQASGQVKELTIASDVYSLGAITKNHSWIASSSSRSCWSLLLMRRMCC
jgi:serine/threonine protein kinase